MDNISLKKLFAAVLIMSAVLLCLGTILMDDAFAEEAAPEAAETQQEAQEGTDEIAAPDAQALVTAENKVTVNPPKKVKSLKLKSNQESVVVLKWRNVDCTGYKVKYSRKKNFTGAVTKRIKGGNSGCTIRGLKKGKKYYFQVRAYRKKKGKVAYGKWSEIKSIVVHKHVYVESTSKISTGTLHTHKCSCGKGYYHTDGKDGKSYDGYLYSFSSCVPGKLQKTIGGSMKALPIKKEHTPVLNSEGKYVCRVCGQTMKYITTSFTEKVTAPPQNLVTEAETEDTVPETQEIVKNVVFAAPKNTNVNACVGVSVINSEGTPLNYKVYWQKSSALEFKYEKYRSYFAMHGCSTCALTTVLNATVPKYEDYTPDRVLEEVIRPVVGEKTFKKNFSKSLKKQMPIGLRGISKVLKANGVKHKYVYNYTKKSAAKEIKEHLKNGNPVIFMIRRSTYASNPHAMVMLGLDKKGRVIVGDSSLCSAKKWGTSNRLVKYNTRSNKSSNTVTNICKFFKYSTKSVKGVTDFYNGKKGNIGYILVYK